MSNTSTLEICDTRIDEESSSVPVLPIALRSDEITEGDFDLLVRIAEDDNLPEGRLLKSNAPIPRILSVGD